MLDLELFGQHLALSFGWEGGRGIPPIRVKCAWPGMLESLTWQAALAVSVDPAMSTLGALADAESRMLAVLDELGLTGLVDHRSRPVGGGRGDRAIGTPTRGRSGLILLACSRKRAGL
jgi:hypothetical protein